MVKSLSHSLFVLLTFFSTSVLSLTNSEIDQQLEHANKIRSNNFSLFEASIAKLANASVQMTNEQKDYLNYLVAYKYTFAGETKKASSILLEILNSPDSALSIKFRARVTLINIFAIQQNWSMGLSHLSQLLNEINHISDAEVYLNGLTITSVFYNQLGQYERGQKYAEQLKEQASKSRELCISKQLIIEASLRLNQLRKNKLNFSDAIDACNQEPIMANFIRSYAASFYIDNNEPQKASDTLSPYLDEIEGTRYPRLIAEVYSTLAIAHWNFHDLKQAEIFAEKSIQVGESIQTTQAVVDAYKLMYQISLRNNNFQSSLKYHTKFAELDKAHLEGEKAKHLAFQLAEHQTFEQESQIKLLNEQNNALAAEQALAKTEAANKKLIILSLALIILVLSVLGFRFYRAHKRVKELAEYDPLTGIFNRGHFTHVTESALKYCKNAQQDLSLIMFDLDHFKKVNDSFGHGCGDWALKETIKVCKSIGRQNDIFARLGGEEFCLVLPSCNIDAAMLRAEDCRAAIEAIITEESTHDFTITASFGVTDVKRSGFNLDKLLADADMAAYESKNAGRNRVTVHQVPEPKKPSLDNAWSID